MKRVLCVGECMLELTHATERTLRLDFAGDTYNTAVYLRRVATELGLHLTGLGVDDYSTAMRAAWRAESILDRSLTVPQRPPGLDAIRTSADGERSFTYWRREAAARKVFAATDWCAELDGDLIHLSGITLQLTSARARETLVTRLCELRAAGACVSLDTNYRPTGWSSPSDAAAAMADVSATADIMLASRDDEELLHGASPPEASVHRLASLGAREVILRDGPNGAYVGVAGAVQRVPARPVERFVDTTAAGDASAGAYHAARLAGETPAHAAAIGDAVAAVVIQHTAPSRRPKSASSIPHPSGTCPKPPQANPPTKEQQNMNPCLPMVAALAIRRKTLERVKAARRSRQSIAPGPRVTAPRSRPMELPSDRSPAPGSAAA